MNEYARLSANSCCSREGRRLVRQGVVGAGLVWAGLVWGCFLGRFPVLGGPPVHSQLPAELPAEASTDKFPLQRSSEMLCWGTDGGTFTQVILVDPTQKRLAVYQVDKASSGVELKSVRNVGPDLSIDALNTKAPLPQEIRAVLGAEARR